ncbi:hypothetical protein KKF91_03980 [Myxococcota bacterium]|nr:hypothetical protein [Myxococcota bacterium]MBU1429703.1 hypothetical protein [Myxococcota bacterium]MBU1899821.1 hypothetical protein [Myxococcota bacterium]
MPLFNEPQTRVQITGSGYHFSGARIADLSATEYTLVTLVCDLSGSVMAYRDQLEACVISIIEACRLSPRADHLMLRLVGFSSRLEEIHGFRPLSLCVPDAYKGALNPGGATALYDASYNAVMAAHLYGQTLTDQGFDCNAIVFVITDGEDNASRGSAAQVGAALRRGVEGESITALTSILIGVGAERAGSALNRELRRFKDKAGFDQYVPLADASAATLAGLADFVSRAIDVQSRYLAEGQVQATLRF